MIQETTQLNLEEEFHKLREKVLEENRLRKEIPRNCMHCYHMQLNDDGTCDHFQEKPPIDFLETINDCKGFEEEIPF